MKAEKALVILLSRLQFSDTIKVRIFHIIKNGVDWYEVLSCCIKTKTICLVYKNLIRLNLEKLLPAVIRSNMRYHYECNSLRNQNLVACSKRIIHDLTEKEIIVIPVKGIRFLTTIYKNDPGIRILSDIDFLALRAHRSAIHFYMKDCGFCTYLINDKDALCSTDKPENSHFYFKSTDSASIGDIRVDIDYSCSDDYITQICKKTNYLGEFFYLCRCYYSVMQEKESPDAVDHFEYTKLVDLHEFYKAYLSHIPHDTIHNAAVKNECLKELDYASSCMEKVYMD